MKRIVTRLGAVGLLAVLGACATVPSGPSVLVLPGTGRSFDQFRFDDMECRQYALHQSGGQSGQAVSDDSALRSAALGTAVGAIAGAAIGGSRGAGVGAGSGLLIGTAAGSSSGQVSAAGSQRRYDNAYVQCMYAKGHRVPVHGQMPAPASYAAPPAPSPAATRIPPPPPPGSPPPPPSAGAPAAPASAAIPPPPPPGNPPPPPASGTPR